MCKAQAPIGVLDSGVGGVYMPRRAVRLLPREEFLFYGDLGHAPYGTRSREEIAHIAREAAEHLLAQGVKAIVIACNTATSAAVEELRATLPVPIIGVEPALKPACEAVQGGTVAVMATPATLRQPRFARLMAAHGAGCRLVSLPCPGLSQMVERCGPGSREIREYLAELFHQGMDEQPDAVVIGCTHYSFLKRDLAALLEGVRIFDGAEGTARQLRHVLEEKGLLAEQSGTVRFETSGPPEGVTMMERFYALAGEDHDD